MEIPFSQLINLITFAFVSILTVGGILIVESVQEQVEEEEKMGAFCGVTSPYADSEQIALGDQIFGAQCATCHAKNMRTNATGPALKGAIKKWNNDTLALFSYIRNPQQYLKEHPKSRISKVHKEFGSATMNAFNGITSA
ncbi:MAG: cytochrome c [Bacteroidota bacterium]